VAKNCQMVTWFLDTLPVGMKKKDKKKKKSQKLGFFFAK
jgi:hypothetical protein